MQALFASPWLWITLCVMVFDWLAAGFKKKPVRYITKPAAMLLLITWFTEISAWRGPLAWFGLGLVFSLAGDIFLLRPERGFLLGLGAFLIGHLFYIIGFNAQPFLWHGLILLILATVAIAAFFIGRHILRGLKRGQSYSRMKKPVLAYMAVIALMLLSALACFFRPGWPFLAAALSSLGAASFLASDSILASDRFVRRRWWAGVTIMVTYHLGQVFILSGALLAFSK